MTKKLFCIYPYGYYRVDNFLENAVKMLMAHPKLDANSVSSKCFLNFYDTVMNV